jgi:imidazolonepropionase
VSSRDFILTNCRAATCAHASTPYGLIERGAVILRAGDIAWVGQAADLPAVGSGVETIDLDGRLVTPGLIDCHTHLVYGGDRAKEFEMRLEGATYAQIARAGGGIRSTVKATRAAGVEELRVCALRRLDAMISEGVTTVEVKSGYGLDLEAEKRMLQVARSLPDHRQVRVCATYLGAHAVPADYDGRADDYIDYVCQTVLPHFAELGLMDAVDAFCESIGFSAAQVDRVFAAATALGLPVKLHAEQLTDQGGAEVAARHGALSADHLEYLSQAGIDAMAQAGTVAVLLPGAFYTLGETQAPPVAGLRKAAVPIAIATDCNPGSSPLASPLTAMNMACILFALTPEEALIGMTRNAALALGIDALTGTLEVGKRADLAIWDVEHPAELAYGIGMNPLHQRIFGGQL